MSSKNNKKLNIVLYEPEIANNVGNIMRTCVAVNAKLHLIEPLGFFLDDRFVKRASANYWPYLEYETYDNWEDFQTKNSNILLYCSTRYANKSHSEIDFKNNNKIFVMFGKESTGIPKSILQANLTTCFRLPMSEHVRSLNVANTVNTVCYEIMRQLDYEGLSKNELQKGEDWIFQNED